MNNEIPLVGEIIVPLDEYPHVQESESIAHGVMQLLQYVSQDGRHLHFDEVLVVNAGDDLVGLLSIREILTSLFPTLLGKNPAEVFAGKRERYTDLSILLEGSFSNECHRQSAMVVKDYMVAAPRAVDSGMHLLHALEIMMKNGLSALPVTVDDQLVGVIRMTDIFKIFGSYCSL